MCFYLYHFLFFWFFISVLIHFFFFWNSFFFQRYPFIRQCYITFLPTLSVYPPYWLFHFLFIFLSSTDRTSVDSLLLVPVQGLNVRFLKTQRFKYFLIKKKSAADRMKGRLNNRWNNQRLIDPRFLYVFGSISGEKRCNKVVFAFVKCIHIFTQNVQLIYIFFR